MPGWKTEAVRAKALAAPLKPRDVNSYRVEAAFLASACRELVAAGVAAPVAHAVDLRPSADDPVSLASRCSRLLAGRRPAALAAGRRGARRSPPRQAARLPGRAVLLAARGAAAAEVEAAVWPAGCYYSRACNRTTSGARSPTSATPMWPSWRPCRGAAGVDLAAIGRRLQSVARAAAAAAHPFDSAAGASDDERARAERFKTIVHGDPKSANLFLREGADGALEVGMIDFQWLGFGLAATDVAHHVVGSIAADALASEAALLDHYHSALCQGLVAFGAASDADDAAASGDAALRAAARSTRRASSTCAGWFSCTNGAVPTLATPSHNKNAYNKSLKNAAWLARRCDALLKGRGARFLLSP